MEKGLILLVEDNEDDVILTKRALNKKKIINRLVVATDGSEAMDFLIGRNGKQPIRPMIILLDLNLPKVSGLQVLEEIKKHEELESIPIIVLTTSSEEEDIVKSYKMGANSYIRKPVDFQQFSKVVEQVGLYWLVLNEPFPH